MITVDVNHLDPQGPVCVTWKGDGADERAAQGFGQSLEQALLELVGQMARMVHGGPPPHITGALDARHVLGAVVYAAGGELIFAEELLRSEPRRVDLIRTDDWRLIARTVD